MRTICNGALTLLLFCGGALMAGCDKATVTETAHKPPAEKAAVPEGFVLAKLPDGVKDVAAVKAGVKDGADVTVRAIIGGAENPFNDNNAVVEIMDLSVQTCDKMGMDKDACKTPWDACCHQDEAKAKGAMVQLLDASGKPMKGSLEGIGGMKPGGEVVVKGKAHMDGGKTMTIDASSIYVKG